MILQYEHVDCIIDGDGGLYGHTSGLQSNVRIEGRRGIVTVNVYCLTLSVTSFTFTPTVMLMYSNCILLFPLLPLLYYLRKHKRAVVRVHDGKQLAVGDRHEVDSPNTICPRCLKRRIQREQKGEQHAMETTVSDGRR